MNRDAKFDNLLETIHNISKHVLIDNNEIISKSFFFTIKLYLN